MITLSWLVAASTIWFLFLVAIKSKLPWKFCAVCVAVSSTWLALLVLKFAGFTVNGIFIAVLMGESVVGLYYMLEKRVPIAWQIFRWPYLITATLLVYLVVGAQENIQGALGLLAVIWFVFGLAYAVRNIPEFKKIAERLIACCRDW